MLRAEQNRRCYYEKKMDGYVASVGNAARYVWVCGCDGAKGGSSLCARRQFYPGGSERAFVDRGKCGTAGGSDQPCRNGQQG